MSWQYNNKSPKIENYYVDQDCHVGIGSEAKTIPAGSFVKPIDRYYVPNFVKEQYPETIGTARSELVFCYTRIGIVPIPRKAIQVSE